MKQKQLVVIGGGAAGFFCAVNAARMAPGLRVTIVEKGNKLLSKVKVSGGGRCNVTHACFSRTEMLQRYPRGATFLKKAFSQFFTTDTITWFAERGVTLKTEADGRMFPVSDSSQTIIDCLLKETNTYGIEVLLNAEVKALRTEGGQFLLMLSGERQLEADNVCIASGGYPKAAQFEWLQQAGHHIETPVPSLFTFNMPGDPICALMGVTLPDVAIRIMSSKLAESGPLLITHWGLSGPAVLKLSAWAARELAERQYAFSIQVNWLPAFNEATLSERLQALRFSLAPQKVINRNPFGLPNRLWEYFLLQAGIKDSIRWADLPAKEQHKLAKIICAQVFAVKGKTTFKEEFVTAGGILLNEIDPLTMESRVVPGAYFAGEVINVDGVTGGFNFQNAWTSGWIAARSIACT